MPAHICVLTPSSLSFNMYEKKQANNLKSNIIEVMINCVQIKFRCHISDIIFLKGFSKVTSIADKART